MTNIKKDRSLTSKRRGRPKKEVYLDPRYEVRIPTHLKDIIGIPQDPVELAAWKQKLIDELLLYYKCGMIRSLIGKVYTPKQLRIKRLVWLSGGGARVAKACCVTRSTLSSWIDRENVPPKYWPTFAKLLEGKISVGDIAKAMIGS